MIDFYITNHTYRLINNHKTDRVIIHYTSDCEKLNADYDENGQYALNTGNLKMYFGTPEEMNRYFLDKGVSETHYCNKCNDRSMAESWEEDLQEQSEEQEMQREIADGSYNYWIPITKIYKAVTTEELKIIEDNNWTKLHYSENQSNPTTQINKAIEYATNNQYQSCPKHFQARI